MLYREIIAVCSEIHTKHINTLCGQNVELLDVKRGYNRVTKRCRTRIKTAAFRMSVPQSFVKDTIYCVHLV
jgi:hypothetical protein